MRYLSRRWVWLLLLIGFSGNYETSFAASTEETLTAAILYNFLKFAEWPAHGVSSDTFTICVSDITPFIDELSAINGRSAQNKTVQIKSIQLGDNPTGCQLLFLPREEKPVRIREWIKNCQALPILVVGNLSDFLNFGGMIQLTKDGDRVRLDVNLEPIKKVDLKLSAQLLKIAHDVKGK